MARFRDRVAIVTGAGARGRHRCGGGTRARLGGRPGGAGRHLRTRASAGRRTRRRGRRRDRRPDRRRGGRAPGARRAGPSTCYNVGNVVTGTPTPCRSGDIVSISSRPRARTRPGQSHRGAAGTWCGLSRAPAPGQRTVVCIQRIHRFTVTVRSRRRGGGTDRAQWHAGGDRRVRALPRPRVGLVRHRDGSGRRRRPRSAGDLATALSSPRPRGSLTKNPNAQRSSTTGGARSRSK